MKQVWRGMVTVRKDALFSFWPDADKCVALDQADWTDQSLTLRFHEGAGTTTLAWERIAEQLPEGLPAPEEAEYQAGIQSIILYFAADKPNPILQPCMPGQAARPIGTLTMHGFRGG